MRASPTTGAWPRARRARCLQLFEEDAGSAHASVSRALQSLKSLAALDAKLASVAALVEEAGIQIREAARELQHYLDGLDVDTGRQDTSRRGSLRSRSSRASIG